MANFRPTEVRTGMVRFSYVSIIEPKAGIDGGNPKYSAVLLIPKSDKKTLAAIESAVDAAIAAGIDSGKFKAGRGGKAPAGLRTPLRDGDDPDDSSYGKDGYAGHFFINASNTRRPGLVDSERNDMHAMHPDDLYDEVYSGMYGRAFLNVYPYSAGGNKGVAASLQHVQKLDDGERLDGGAKAADVFSDEDDDLLG